MLAVQICIQLRDTSPLGKEEVQTLTWSRCRNISTGPSSRDVTAEAHRAAEESTHGFVTDDGAGLGGEAPRGSGRGACWAVSTADDADSMTAAGDDGAAAQAPTRKVTAATDLRLTAPAASPGIGRLSFMMLIACSPALKPDAGAGRSAAESR